MRLLFDRIFEPLADDFASPKQRLEQELRSVEEELNRLFNSRSYLSGFGLSKPHTILDYGLDNIVSCESQGAGRLNAVIDNVRNAIRAFEPRIVGPIVQGDYVAGDPTKLKLTVAGKLRESSEPFRFQIPLTLPSVDSR